jgi:CRISPR/Cas system-associated protein Cas10 (large subunit of type III CRISPR-Cas system)
MENIKNNKGRRTELTQLKFKKRLKKHLIKKEDAKNNYALKSHGMPCSCSVCSHNKFKRSKIKINFLAD